MRSLKEDEIVPNDYVGGDEEMFFFFLKKQSINLIINVFSSSISYEVKLSYEAESGLRVFSEKVCQRLFGFSTLKPGNLLLLSYFFSDFGTQTLFFFFYFTKNQNKNKLSEEF